MTYSYEVKHTLGSAQGSVEADSPLEAENKVRSQYTDLSDPAEKMEVIQVTVSEA